MSQDASPAESAVAVTPSDTVGFAATKGLYVGGAGAAVVIMKDGREVTFSGITAGTVLPIRITRVNSTSTTATLMVALY